MKFLPREDLDLPSPQAGGRLGKPAKHRSGRRQPGPPELIKHQVALKKISLRLNRYAKHELPDDGILDLLEETRAQVLSLHLARKQLERKEKSKKHRKK